MHVTYIIDFQLRAMYTNTFQNLLDLAQETFDVQW